jgi:hypothetical protein
MLQHLPGSDISRQGRHSTPRESLSVITGAGVGESAYNLRAPRTSLVQVLLRARLAPITDLIASFLSLRVAGNLKARQAL